MHATPEPVNPQDLGAAPVLEEQARAFHRAVPLYLAVPVLFWLGLRGLGIFPEWSLLAIGAAGWWLALLLRAPVALLARKLPQERAKLLVVASSGPLEEGVRLAAVLLLAPGLAGALALGLGWAAIEVLFTVANGLVVVRLIRRDDEQARQVREVLEGQGALSASAPWLGIVERVLASFLHLGFTLLVAAQPPLAVATAPLHSGVNLLAVRLSPRLGRVMGMLAVVSLATLACGLALMGVAG